MSFTQRSRNRIEQALKQAPWRTQAQATSLLMIMLLVVVVIGAFYVAQASRTAAAGRRLQTLEGERQVLEQQNAQLRAEVAALRSVPRLISQAEAVGYHPATSSEVEYLNMPGEAPVIEATATPFPDASELVPTYNETLEEWLTEQVGGIVAQIGQVIQTTFGQDESQ